MKKMFDESVLKKRIFIIVCITVVVNIVSLLLWYNFRIKPAFIYNNEVRKKIEVNELKKEYEDKETFEKELDRISKKYNAKFRVVDENKNEILTIDVKDADFFLFSDVISVDDEMYILNAYLHRNFSFTSMTISLIIFQIFVIFVLMTSTFFATGKTIINPIQRIVSDIRNYKFGKKPVKNEVNTELDIIQNEFVNLVDSLEEEKKEQNRIIASISHDIKTPLTSIIGYSSLMDDDNLSIEEVREYSKKINEKAKHIKSILGTFDDYLTNYDNKKLKLDNILVKDIISEINSDYKIELNNNGIEFNVECDCGNVLIKVDVLKLKRIISNIISNSIRYVSDDGRIDVLVTKEENFVRFSIRDNGSGVDEKIIDKIFDPFFTTDSSRKISGLGLSIVKEFVEMHGGEIVAKNNDGFMIEFTIPISDEKTIAKKKKEKK